MTTATAFKTKRFSPESLRNAAVERRVTVLFSVWLGVAVLLTVIANKSALSIPFDWMSADSSVIAQSFVHNGVLALGGVPINNNPPLGLQPDAYIHWPPLFQILLSVAFRAFGESEVVGYSFMCLILFANSLALYALVR